MYKRIFVLARAMKTEPVVLTIDCIIATGASHINNVETKNHFSPRKTRTNSWLTIARPSIRGGMIMDITLNV